MEPYPPVKVEMAQTAKMPFLKDMISDAPKGDDDITSAALGMQR